MTLTKNIKIDLTLYLNYMIIAYAFFLPISRAGISLFTFLSVLLWIIEGNFKHKIHLIVRNKVILALFAFIAMNFISLFWTNNIDDSLGYIRRYWYLFPILVLYTSIKKEYISTILSAFIMGMFVSEVIGYGVFFELWKFKDTLKGNISPFMHHIEYSIFLAFTSLILLSRIFSSIKLKSKIIYSFFFVTISANLFLTEGRTGQLALIVGLFVLALISFKNKFKALIISSLLTIFLLGGAYMFSSTFQNRVADASDSIINVIQNKNYCTSWGSRIGAYITAQNIVTQHPMIGAGITDNMQMFRTLIDTKYPYMMCIKELSHMHNQYLQILTQLGIIGLFFFLLIFYMVANIQIKDISYNNMKYIYLSVLCVGFVSETLFHRAFSLALFTFLIGLLLAQHRVEHEI